VISAGAVDDQGTKGPGDDLLATWSSRGTTQDAIAKPDVFAPGAKIVSNLAPGSLFTGMCPTRIVNGEYIRAGGTSMAAPMVSGTVALLLELNPALTPDQVKGLLKKMGPAADGVLHRVGRRDAPRILVRLRLTRRLQPLGGPDNVSMAAVALAISGGGALSSLETTVLLTVDETMDALQKAGKSSTKRPARSGGRVPDASGHRAAALARRPVTGAALSRRVTSERLDDLRRRPAWEE